MTNSHRNDERTVRCPVCGAEKLARGIHLHIRQSVGDGHGPQGDVPEHLDLKNLETVGEKEVEMNYPAERNSEQVARLCPYCSSPYKGKNGVLIHLGQVAGRNNHPEDGAEQHAETDFPRVKLDKRGNVTSVIDKIEEPETEETGKGQISEKRVYHLIAELMTHGDGEAAHRVRRHLLGIDTEDRTLRENPTHSKLFDALVTQSQAGQTDHRVSAALESEGIMVACRGESAFYNAEEARDVAAGLERATGGEQPVSEISDLIEFLRFGADILDGEPPRNLHEELADWR